MRQRIANTDKASSKTIQGVLHFLTQCWQSINNQLPSAPFEYGIDVPMSLFDRLGRDDIIAMCHIINIDKSQPFLLTHEWGDDLRLEDHSIRAYIVHPSMKSSVALMKGCSVVGCWETFPPYGIFVAKVTEVIPKPFIDCAPFEPPELLFEVQFVVDVNGQLIEPSQPMRLSCDRYMLSGILKNLSKEEIEELKVHFLNLRRSLMQ
jgi:hypothetical protein